MLDELQLPLDCKCPIVVVMGLLACGLPPEWILSSLLLHLLSLPCALTLSLATLFVSPEFFDPVSEITVLNLAVLACAAPLRLLLEALTESPQRLTDHDGLGQSEQVGSEGDAVFKCSDLVLACVEKLDLIVTD